MESKRSESSDVKPAAARVANVPAAHYTKRGLIGVFFWLLLGDFCLHLMDMGVVPTLVPLQFEALGASKTTYNFVNGTLVNILYVVIVP
ncbi:MAG: hypothetical protein ACK58T_40860, partial [Phycisphaerae bacterium]